MNKKMVLAALSIVALAGTVAYADLAPGTGVVGSVHDMKTYQSATPDLNDPETNNGRVCAYCHTPHHAITEGHDYLPLWSHKLTTNGTFTPYFSATIDASIDPQTMMEGPSKLCMSCHDGTVAVDTHYGFTGGKSLNVAQDSDPTNPTIGGSANLGNDHPIGFIYDEADGGVASGDISGANPVVNGPGDEWIKRKGAVYTNTTLTIAERLYLSPTAGAPIMTCATCHDVHNRKNKDEAAATNYLLLASNQGSSLCLSCHIK